MTAAVAGCGEHPSLLARFAGGSVQRLAGSASLVDIQNPADRRPAPRWSAGLKQRCPGSALPLSRWPGPQVHDALGRIWWRVTEPGPRADHTLRMPERIDEVTSDRAAFNMPADGDDT